MHSICECSSDTKNFSGWGFNFIRKGLHSLWATDLASTKFSVVETNFTSHSVCITLEKSADVG